MFYVSAKLFLLVFTPSNFIAILLIMGAALQASGIRQVLGRRLLYTGVIMLAVCGFSPLGSWLSVPLEERFPRPTLPSDVTGIILLGGYEVPPVSDYRHSIEVNEAADRLLETLLLAKRYPRAKVVLTGAYATILPNNVDATAPIAAFLRTAGIAANRIVSENKSRNTYQNALLTRRMLGSIKGQTYVLVTSAFHMPRAVGTFRALGFDVLAWPSDYRTIGWTDTMTLFRWVLQGMERVDLASKEWVGLLAYRLTGRSNALLPSP